MDHENEIAELRRALRVLVGQLTEPETPEDDASIKAQLERHLNGADVLTLPILSEHLESWDLPNLQLALEGLLGPISDSHQVLGLPAQVHHYGELSISLLLEHGFHTAPLQYTNVEIGPTQLLPCLHTALHLTTYRDQPLVLFTFIADENRPGGGGLMVQALTTDEATATAFLSELRAAIDEHDVFRGQVITVSADRFGRRKVTFVERAELDAASLVLPEGVLDRVVQHVVGPTEHRERLLAQGQHLSRGLLLWGPPGTGKTHTVRYLTNLLTDATVVLLSAGSLGMVGGFAGLARRLAPAVVVLEDVDLVAQHRFVGPGGSGNSVLFELMDEMSGHSSDADIAFVLTTNMPEALEPALAARPGRVDLAVEIPLPDGPSRRQLFGVYSQGVIDSIPRIDEFVERTEGVTASFIRELMRKAALRAAVADVPVMDEHIAAALDELLTDTSALTRTLLGVGGPGAPETEHHGTTAQFLQSFPTDMTFG